MARKFIIPSIYEPAETDSVTLKENDITILVGKNGYGKTSFLYGIEEAFKKDNTVTIVSWSDSKYGRDAGRSILGFHEDYEGLASMAFVSEGQTMMSSFARFFMQRAGGASRRRKPGQDTMFLLVDQLDSGLDSHQIRYIKEVIRNIVIPDMTGQGITVFIIMSANSYELVMGEDCLDPMTRKHLKFKTIQEYMDYIDSQYKKDEKNEE